MSLLKKNRVLFAALCLALVTPAWGCASKDTSKKDHSSQDDDDDDDSDSNHKKKKSKKHDNDDEDDSKKSAAKKTDSSATAKAASNKDVDAKTMLADDGAPAAPSFDVHLPGDEAKDAPSMGSGDLPAAPSQPGEKAARIVFLDAGPLAVPAFSNWTRMDRNGATTLFSPNKKGVVMFMQFGTDADGAAKVDGVMAALQMRNMQWRRAKPVRLGPNKVPALFGTGNGFNKDGTKAKLFYALIRTGGSVNLLALGGADDGFTQELESALVSVAYIRRR